MSEMMGEDEMERGLRETGELRRREEEGKGERRSWREMRVRGG